MILSTEDHKELMQNIAAKTAAQFSLIPPIPSICSEESAVDHLQTGVDDDSILLNTENSSKTDVLFSKNLQFIY